MRRQHYETAAPRLEKAKALFENCDEELLAPSLRAFLGTSLLARREAERAERAFEEALASARIRKEGRAPSEGVGGEIPENAFEKDASSGGGTHAHSKKGA